MMATALEVERTLYIAFDILLDRYPSDRGAGHKLADIWNYLLSSDIDDHRTLVQVVQEQLNAK